MLWWSYGTLINTTLLFVTQVHNWKKSSAMYCQSNHSEHIHTAKDIHLQANKCSNVCSKTYQWPAPCSTWSTHASCTSFSTTTDVSNRSMACRFYNVPELTDVLYVYSLSWSVYFVHVYIWALSTLCLWKLIVYILEGTHDSYTSCTHCFCVSPCPEEVRQDHVILDRPLFSNTNCHRKISNLL